MNTKKINKEQILAVLLFAFFYIIQLCLIGYTITFFKACGASEQIAGIVVAIACAIATFLQPVLGNVADRSRRFNWKIILYILTIILIVISVRLIFFNASMLDIILFCAAIVIAFCMSPLINESCFYYNTKEHPVSFGPARAGGSLSYALVSWLIGSLMEKISPAVVPTAALIAGVGTLVILLIMPKVDHITRETTDNSLATEESNSSKVSFFAFIKKYSVFFIFFFALIFIFTFQNLFSANLINIVNDADGNYETFGIATAIAAIVELPVMFLFSKILKKFSSQSLIVFAAICYIIRSILFIIASNIALIIIAQILQALTYAIIIPSMVYLSDDTMSKEDKNKGQTIMGMTISIGTILGFLLESSLVGNGTQFVMIIGMVITSIGALLAVIAYILYRKKRGTNNNE